MTPLISVETAVLYINKQCLF